MEKENTCMCLVGVITGAVSIEDNMEISEELKNIELPYYPAFPLLGIYPLAQQGPYLYYHVHNSIIHNSQDSETTYMFADQ